MAIKIFLDGTKWHFFVSAMYSARETDNSVLYKTSCRSTGRVMGWGPFSAPCDIVHGSHYLLPWVSTFSRKGTGFFLEKFHACVLLSSLMLLLALSFVTEQNTLGKVECQYIGHCSNTKSKQHSLHWRACDQNSQDKAWKDREYLKSKVISFSFGLSKCSFSLATQIFPPTSLNSLLVWGNWNYHVLTSKERPSLSFSNHNHLKWATELSSEHSAFEASFVFSDPTMY